VSELLRISNISKYYSGVKALDDLSFSIQEGEVHAICGENGAGKSTLIKILTGAIQPTSGYFEFNGEKYSRMSPGKAIELGIIAIYQEFTLIPYLSVSDNLFYGHEIMKGLVRDRAEMNRQTIQLCQRIGVNLDPDAKIASLGIAKQQIVEILKAVSQNAKLFIMDEPTAPLTIKDTEVFFNIIKNLKATGATVIFITHRLEEVFELCDRVTVLCDGKLVATENTSQFDRHQLISCMVGREIADSYPQSVNPDKSGEVILKVNKIVSPFLHDIKFELHMGEILGFGGLVGARRTELARALFGADRSTFADIVLNGKPYSPKNPAHALSEGIGLIPEDRKSQGLIMELSVQSNITIGLLRWISNKLLYINPKQERKYSKQYIDELNIKTPSEQQLVKNLSGGNQQKVILSKMLAIDCDILIFDEPTRGIDVGAKQEIYSLLRNLADSGKSIIMISSEMTELIGMSDRIIVMSNGYIARNMQKEEYSQTAILEAASSML
jgi:ribose transport system ATP-binding protein